MKFNIRYRALVAAMAAAGLACGCGGDDDATPPAPTVADAEDAALKFDAATYTTVNVTVDGVATRVRQYRVVYVARPVKAALTQTALNGSTVTLTDPYAYQTMIVSVPETSAADQKQALYVAVNNGGWYASAVATTINEGQAFVSTNNTDNIGAALKAGYVVVNVGTRSRGFRAEDGSWAGKAPAPVVDAKAAVRYLRLNDAAMPGSAERIVLTGTSGGGGLTAAVAAAGNSADHLPFLEAIGAAGIAGTGSTATSAIKDDVFAAVAYCPINNLGSADAGYEWEYGALRSDANTNALNNVAYSAAGSLQPAASAAYAAAFPAYFNGLGLTLENGAALTTTSLRDATKALLIQEIERQIAAGVAVPQLGGTFTPSPLYAGRTTTFAPVNDWLTLTGTGTSARVADLDYDKFLRFVTTLQRLKTVVAFDAVGVTDNRNATTGAWNISGETNLFGSGAFPYSNFTEWAWANNQVRGDGSGADDTALTWSQTLAANTNGLATQLRLINPVAYLNTATADAAPYWYVRHGLIDRDTAFAMQTLLYHAIRRDASVRETSFKYNYLVPHQGNYDVQEAFAWIKAKLDANP